VSVRLDERLAARVDASDVVQETLTEAVRRLDEFRRTSKVPDYIWLRWLALQQVALAHRKHFGVLARDVRRDQSIERAGAVPNASASAAGLAHLLLAQCPTPSQAACRAEVGGRVRQALEELEPIDREVLALRHFEQLTNAEAARVLGITVSGASKRYIRALQRIRTVLSDLQD
jgi:RNA polymerase sigma-70 factor (ECF subfamily)